VSIRDGQLLPPAVARGHATEDNPDPVLVRASPARREDSGALLPMPEIRMASSVHQTVQAREYLAVTWAEGRREEASQ